MDTDYIFRYPLEAERSPPHYRHCLTELVRVQLENILNLAVPLYRGKEVKVDGFRLLSDAEAEYELFPKVERPLPADPWVRNAQLYEPRIDFIKRQLESLLQVVELERGRRPAKVDGFRLRDLTDWLVASSGDPTDIITYAGGRCDCACLFCFIRGNPPHFPLLTPPRAAAEEFAEIKTRLEHFSPRAGRALFPRFGCEYEVMAHPHFLEVLRLLRPKTEKAFRITTNGRRLTPEMVSSLAELKPIYLYLSLNSSSPRRRRQLMRDNRPQVAINSLPLLREAGIPFAVVIVPWPVDSSDEMLADMVETVAYADSEQAHIVQINLPGNSQFFSPEKLFDLEEVWSAVVSKVRELRGKTGCPIVVMPSMYEENLFAKRKNLPIIVGAVRNSPAERSGLRGDDLVVRIGGVSVSSRPQARDLLSVLQSGTQPRARVSVDRGGKMVELDINLKDFSYPYSPDSDSHLGVIFRGTGLRPSYLDKLKEVIDSSGATTVLFLSSALVRPTLGQMLAESPLFGQVHIEVAVPQNRFFGGNIFMGDLLVVEDYIDCINDYLKAHKSAPDLVVIPSSPFHLGGWGRDLTGRVYLDIEREVGIAVALLPCATIYE